MATLITSSKRPRDLHWFHAGPLLFGDWGTSRLYVLGLAFYYTGHASPIYLGAMSLIMIAVAWAYSVICRCFPEGGGVYAAARQLSPTLSVIGATLLLCDYIVTAALSVIEGFHYLGTAESLVVPLSIGTIGLIGVINWLGAKSAGRFALIIAVAAIILSAGLGVLCIPMLREGLSTLTTGDASISGPWVRWENLVRIILALSGLEAVANMTGLMKEPVAGNAKKTIYPVLIEVIALNLIFGIALNALPALKNVTQPDYVTHEIVGKLDSDAVPVAVREYRDTAVKLLAEHAGTEAFGVSVGHWLGIATGIIFGLLLISAVNTAVMAMVSVKYSMAHDRELPSGLKKLNYSGVPWVGLIVACMLPAGLLLFQADPKALGELYAIGVVGAIAINVLSCAVNKSLPITKRERIGMWALGIFMAIVEMTIVVAKPHATVFAGGMIAIVLTIRYFFRRLTAKAAPQPTIDWLAEVKREPLKLDPFKPRIMLASRGRQQAEAAVDLAQQRRATLFVIFVRTLRLLNLAEGAAPRIEDDPDAQEALGTVMALARERGVPCVPIYVCSPSISEEILDYTVTFGCETLIVGRSKRSAVSRSVEGDVTAEIKAHLPASVELIERDGGGGGGSGGGGGGGGTLLPDAPTSVDVGVVAPAAASSSAGGTPSAAAGGPPGAAGLSPPASASPPASSPPSSGPPGQS